LSIHQTFDVIRRFRWGEINVDMAQNTADNDADSTSDVDVDAGHDSAWKL
jgi:hypothetical protein